MREKLWGNFEDFTFRELGMGKNKGMLGLYSAINLIVFITLEDKNNEEKVMNL